MVIRSQKSLRFERLYSPIFSYISLINIKWSSSFNTSRYLSSPIRIRVISSELSITSTDSLGRYRRTILFGLARITRAFDFVGYFGAGVRLVGFLVGAADNAPDIKNGGGTIAYIGAGVPPCKYAGPGGLGGPGVDVPYVYRIVYVDRGPRLEVPGPGIYSTDMWITGTGGSKLGSI